MSNSTINLIKKSQSKYYFSPSDDLGLEPYSGEWTQKEAAHLLRRATFGPNYDQIKASVQLGLQKSIDILFSPVSDPGLPINYYFKDDPEVPVGETWVGKKVTPNVQGLIPARNNSLSAWITRLMLSDTPNVIEKLMLFWHNHLVISNIFNPNFKYSYILLLRKYALGDFRELMKKMTIEPAMLLYLNGNENTATAPNENYAREVLELFTIGKGPLVGDGDYTNYTEQDVVELARALSGWTIRQGKAFFRSNKHDKGQKQLSHRFNNAVIDNQGEEEYKKVIDIIFEQEEVSRFISRQLYIWYVNYNITNDIENNVIEPMAKILRDNNYVIEPALKALLMSDHFFNECNHGEMVKSPMDFTLSLIKTGNVPEPTEEIPQYYLANYLNRQVFNKMEQAYFFIPSVAGWKAYYQEPVFYKFWISSVTLPLRRNVVNALVDKKAKLRGVKFGMDLLGLISKFDSPENPDLLLKSFTDLFLPYDLTEEQYEFLKTQVLIPGLPDYEWTVEYNDYKNNPNDTSKANAINKKLQNVCKILLNLPENQLM